MLYSSSLLLTTRQLFRLFPANFIKKLNQPSHQNKCTKKLRSENIFRMNLRIHLRIHFKYINWWGWAFCLRIREILTPEGTATHTVKIGESKTFRNAASGGTWRDKATILLYIHILVTTFQSVFARYWQAYVRNPKRNGKGWLLHFPYRLVAKISFFWGCSVGHESKIMFTVPKC